jgi:hypothetical protein
MQTKARAPTQEGHVSLRRNETTVIFVGHARLPRSLAPRDSSSVVSVELEAEIASGTIMGTSVKGVLPLGTRLLDEVLAGRRIGDGPQEAVEEIRQRYVCPSQKALCTAVANAYEAYYRYRQQDVPSS